MIIKTSEAMSEVRPATIGLAEWAVLDGPTGGERLRGEAARLVAEAKQASERIRRQAAEEGHREGHRIAQEEAARRQGEQGSALRSVVDALVAEIDDAKCAWLEHWQRSAVGLAVAIAERILRRELAARPQVSRELVRETLELAGGGDQVRILLHPDDARAMADQVAEVARALGSLGLVEVVGDASIGVGGCRVETRFGSIDQQIDTQLRRIEEELNG